MEVRGSGVQVRRVFWSSEVSRLLELGFDGVVFSLDFRRASAIDSA